MKIYFSILRITLQEQFLWCSAFCNNNYIFFIQGLWKLYNVWCQVTLFQLNKLEIYDITLNIYRIRKTFNRYRILINFCAFWLYALVCFKDKSPVEDDTYFETYPAIHQTIENNQWWKCKLQHGKNQLIIMSAERKVIDLVNCQLISCMQIKIRQSMSMILLQEHH